MPLPTPETEKLLMRSIRDYLMKPEQRLMLPLFPVMLSTAEERIHRGIEALHLPKTKKNAIDVIAD